MSLFDDSVTAPGYGLKRVCEVVRPGCLPILEDIRATDVEVVVTADVTDIIIIKIEFGPCYS